MAEIAILRESKLEPTPSMGYCNLSVNTDGSMAFSHAEDVVVVRSLGPARLAQPEATKAAVTSVAYGAVRSRPLLFFTNRYVTTAHDITRDTAILSLPSDGNGDPRCTAVIDVEGQVSLAVGTTSGSITVHDLSATLEVAGATKLSQHTSSITCLTSVRADFVPSASSTALISGDAEGRVCCWSAKGVCNGSVCYDGDCATSAVVISPTLVAVAFGSGTIRLLDMATCSIRVAIGASNRWINALAYCTATARLASVGDDNAVCLWAMPTAASPSIALVGHRVFPNALLTGAAFSNDGAALSVVAYDVDTLWTLGVAGL